MRYSILGTILCVLCAGCVGDDSATNQEAKTVARQQSQYAKGQPVPVFDWSLERHLLYELYSLRNREVATHAVWRSNYGMIEGDCPAMGYGLPYDTSMTNPLMVTDEDQTGRRTNSLAVIEQPEPNGLFSSKTTTATWVMCLGESGNIEPVYIEAKVTVYPGSVKVDYTNNRVVRTGAATATISNK